MRELTPEQKQKSDERKARFREVVKKVANMQQGERDALAAKLLGVTNCEGHSLSLHNTYLLALQMQSATIVGGFRQWIKQGRAVRKGEHGATIWFPFKNKDKAGETAPEPTDLHFGTTTVFDVSQTDEITVKP